MTRAQRDRFVGRLVPAISNDRIQQYFEKTGQARWEALASYAWNIALCEAFYPLLHGIELVLRNSLDRAIQTRWVSRGCLQIQSWLDAQPSYLNDYGRQDVKRAKVKLLRPGSAPNVLVQPPHGRPITHPDLVAALDFGFWTGLLHRDYKTRNASDRRLWPDLQSSAFPHAPHRDIVPISKAFNDVRKFRNRVFHHEPIWRGDLEKIRGQIFTLMEWSNPEAAQLVRALDRVPAVLNNDFRRELRVRIYRECRR